METIIVCSRIPAIDRKPSKNYEGFNFTQCSTQSGIKNC